MPKIKIKDRRKIDYVSKKPIGEKNNLSGEYDEEIVDRIIKSAKAHNIDPYTALAMGLQETQLGQGRFRNNPGFDTGVQRKDNTWSIVTNQVKQDQQVFNARQDQQQTYLKSDTNRYSDKQKTEQRNYNKFDEKRDVVGNTIKSFGIDPRLPFTNPKEFAFQAALGALPIDKLGKLGKVLGTSEGILSDVHKINPWAFKPNPNAYYRGLGKTGLDDAFENKVLRTANKTGNYGEDLYMTPDFNVAKGAYSKDQSTYIGDAFGDANSRWEEILPKDSKSYIAEIPKSKLTNPEIIGNKVTINKGSLPIDDVKFYKENWLQGYREVKPKETNSSITNSVLNPLKSKFSNSIEGLKMELENIKPRFNKNVRSDSKQALKEANEWQKEWYNHPETQMRIDDKVRKQDKEVFNHMFDAVNNKNLIDPDIYKLHSGINPGWRGMKERIKNEDYKVNFESGINKVVNILGNNEPVHKGNLGVSGYGMDFTKDLFRNPNNLKRQNLVRKYMRPNNIKGVAVHEGSHGVTDGNQIIASSKKEMKEAFHHPDDEAVIKNLGIKDARYYTKPTEIYARIMDLRNAENLRPGQLLGITQVKNMITKGETGAYGRSLHKDFFQLIKDPEKFRKLMNTLPAVGGAAYIGSEKTKNTNNKWSIIN